MDEPKIALSKLITAVTAELRKAETDAQAARQGEARDSAVMQFAECELEIGVEIETKGEAGINIWVFKLGGDRTKKDTSTIRIKFNSNPTNTIMYNMPTEGKGPALG